MDRTDDLRVAGAAAIGTLILVVGGELYAAGDVYTRGLPLAVYFLYAVVHDPERGGLDVVRTWVGLAGAVTAATLAWFVLG